MNDFRDKLCPANIQLLTEIEKSIPIVFQEWDKYNWGAQIINNKTIGMIYHPSKFSDAKAAHELLHIKIELIMGTNEVLRNEAILWGIKQPVLPYLFQKNVCEHFLNSYEHTKIFAEYQAMGFAEDDFFTENDDDAELFNHISHHNLSNGQQYNLPLLGEYICTTIAYLSHPYKDFKTKKKLLKRADEQLFKIIKNYWDTILSIQLTPAGKLLIDKEHTKFIHNMANWASTKNFSQI